ncbi:gem-associated protein 8 [Patella vulgata]|uniref:gem-associated protein 8 n=1 Tax=Patella vulgata TaxID=6465 RepID=UPI00217F5B9F|nr:gem-associated protein 8 [Patella vulgata]XP_050415728.1 gem-associated protein 8 [Patella vulgata]XP_050415730.1 gem-associated protein 8 [Patella vulgata]
MEIKDFETSSVTADSSPDSDDLTSVTETQYEISADNLLKPDTGIDSNSDYVPDNQDNSKSRHCRPDMSSPYWYNDKCFARYWRHYHQVMGWYQKHLNVYKSMQQQCYSDSSTFRPYQSRRRNNQPKEHNHHHHHHHRTKRRRRSKHKSKKLCESDREAGESSSVGNQEEPMSGTEAGEAVGTSEKEEFEMEITDDMLQFFAHSQQHRKERDMKKDDELEDDSRSNVRVNIEDVHKQMPTVEAPKERPGVRRTAEMKMLYGKGAAMIHGMETALQMTYDRNIDVQQPKVWPNIPLRITFAD